jgi:hypothetical protein
MRSSGLLLIVAIAACQDETVKPPIDTMPGGGGLSGGQPVNGDDGGSTPVLDAGPPCVPQLPADASTADFDVTTTQGGSGSIIGSIRLPAVPDPNALVVLTVLNASNVTIESMQVRPQVSKGTYLFRIQNLPATSDRHVYRLRADVDATSDGAVGGLGDYAGYFVANAVNPVTDPLLAASFDILTKCSGLDFSLDLVRQ